MLSPIRYGPQIEAAAQRHGLDPRLLAAVAAQETGGPGSNSGANIVGDGGHGRGLFQIDDRWHAFAKTPAAMDPAQNADYAAGMISGLLSEYGDVHEALSAYNAGSPHATGTRTTWGDGANLGYADSVLRHYTELGGAPMGGVAVGAEAAPAGDGAGAGAAGGAGAIGAPGGAAASSGGYVPPVTVPQPIPYPSQFRSFAAMAQQGGPGAQVDAEMIGLLDPGDGSSSN
ncbi:MAG: transglycosylase SLT domain-containing protein [Candidatus Baltobacteraceae bacterium]